MGEDMGKNERDRGKGNYYQIILNEGKIFSIKEKKVDI